MELLEHIFTNNLPLIDVRAEVEFAKGAFPSSVNLPILDDEERKAVGICYKEQGPVAAECLGYELISGEIRANRINQWKSFIAGHEESYLYCFRGGKRSQIAVEWLSEAGVEIEKIEGGYKYLRNYLVTQLDTLPSRFQIFILSGRTGSGKTELLKKLPHTLDLEAMANHRGSAFGKKSTPQPTQISFENQLAISLMQQNAESVRINDRLLLEDESRTIGKTCLPSSLFSLMQNAPVLLLEDSLDNRVERIYKEYILQQFEEHLALCNDEDVVNNQLRDTFLDNLRSISRRLGGLAYGRISALMEDAFSDIRSGTPGEAHMKWISALLETYYDPMYNYQIQKKESRIVHRGTAHELNRWLNDERNQS